MRLIIKIFDEQMAEKVKEFFNIHFTLSASAIADDKFYEILKTVLNKILIIKYILYLNSDVIMTKNN